MATLVKNANIDYDYTVKEAKGGDLRRLLENLRSEVELFYSRGSISDAISSLNAKHEEEAQRKKEQQQVVLSHKSDDELIGYMKGREEILKTRSVEELAVRIRRDQRLRPKLQDNADLLLRLLQTSDVAVLNNVLSILKCLFDESFKATLRKIGFRPITKLLSAPELVEDDDLLKNLLSVIVFLATSEENRDLFRTVNALGRIVPFLTHSDPGAQMMALETLMQLSIAYDNRMPLAKLQVHNVALQYAQSEEPKRRLLALNLMKNLASSDIYREQVTLDDFRQILVHLDPANVYLNQTPTLEYFEGVKVQKAILECLAELAAIDKNQRILGQLGIIQTLNGFYNPLKNPNASWDFEVLTFVLRLSQNLIQQPNNRTLFFDLQGIDIMTLLLKEYAKLPPDCIIYASSVFVTLCTKATVNQQAYHQHGSRTMMGLCSKLNEIEEIVELTSVMLNTTASKGINKQFLIDQSADRLLIKLIKESNSKTILVNACDALGYLCSEGNVVQKVVESRIIQNLIALLQLRSPELSTNVARVLACVAANNAEGLLEIVEKGGVLPLVTLLEPRQPNEVKEQALLTFGKVLFAPGRGRENIQYFFQCNGERNLIECMSSEAEEVQVPALSIIHELSITEADRDALRKSNIDEKLKALESHANVIKSGSQVANFVRMIKMHMKEDNVARKIKSTAQAEKEKEKKRIPRIWVKVVFEYNAKILPLKEHMEFDDFLEMISVEFGVNNWRSITLTTTLSPNEVPVVDQNRLDYLIDCAQKDPVCSVNVEAQHPSVVVPQTESIAKLDGLLCKLNHNQLRTLVKNAIDNQANLTDPIRNYMNVNRNCHGQWVSPEERREEEMQNMPAPKDNPSGSGVANRPVPPKPGMAGGPPVPGSGGPPAPPPPPVLTTGSNKLVINKGVGAGKVAGSGDLIGQLKSAVGTSGFLKRADISEKELEKRGIGVATKLRKTVVEEEVEQNARLWQIDQRIFVDHVQAAFLKEYSIMNIIFQTIDNDVLTWEDARKLLTKKTMPDNELAEILKEAGMDVKFQKYTVEGEHTVQKEFIDVLCPSDLPRWIVLKTIQSVLKVNGSKGSANIVDEEDSGIIKWGGSGRRNASGAGSGGASPTSPTSPARTTSLQHTVSRPSVTPVQAATPAAPVASWSSRKKEVPKPQSLWGNDDDEPETKAETVVWSGRTEKPKQVQSLWADDDEEDQEPAWGPVVVEERKPEVSVEDIRKKWADYYAAEEEETPAETTPDDGDKPFWEM